MKLFKTILMLLCILGLIVGSVFAENFPSNQLPAAQPIAQPGTPQPQVFYGYVPPAPIQHTWPGGYKVIFHELTNTLVDHILGRY